MTSNSKTQFIILFFLISVFTMSAQSNEVVIESLVGSRVNLTVDGIQDTTSLELRNGSIDSFHTHFIWKNQSDQLFLDTYSDLSGADEAKIVIDHKGCVNIASIIDGPSVLKSVLVDPNTGNLISTIKDATIRLGAYDAYIEGASSYTDGIGTSTSVAWPSSQQSAIAWSLYLPDDYEPGSNIDVEVLVSGNATGNCSFKENFASAIRPGNANVGIDYSPSINTVVNIAIVGLPQLESYVITSPNLLPGDLVNFGHFKRNTDPYSGTLRIHGIKLKYQTAQFSDCISANVAARTGR